MLLAMRWRDKRDVGMLTTVHTASIVDTNKKHHETGQPIRKPECIDSYNKNMGAVDKTDMQISFTECTRKTRKWYRKLFFHLVDLCLYNAYVLYKVNTNSNKLHFVEFRTRVCEQLFEAHTPLRTRNSGGRPSSSASTLECNPLRLVGMCVYTVKVQIVSKIFRAAFSLPNTPYGNARNTNTATVLCMLTHTTTAQEEK